MTRDDRARMEERLDEWDRALYRNRHIAGPPFLAVLVAVIALGGWVAGVWWIVGILAAIVWLLATDHWLDLPTRKEQVYAVACWTSAGAWATFTAWHGPTGWLWLLLGLGTLALGIPWAHHRRVRRGVDVDRAIEAWGDGGAVGLKGTRARGTKAGSGWFSFKLTADEPGTVTLADYKQHAHRIAARFGVRAEAVSFATTTHEGEVEVTIRDAERVETQPEEEPTATAMAEPFRVGATDNGEPIEHALYITEWGAQHGGMTGSTGAGKSGLINRYAEHAARSADTLLWIVDLSLGAKELRGWAPVCDWFAHTTGQVEAMLDALPRICQSRGGGQGRVHVPTVDEPGIVLLIDEGASVWAPELIAAEADWTARRNAQRVAAGRQDKAAELLRQARKYAVAVHEATQYGVDEAFGGAQAKQQLLSGYASVFRSGKDTHGHLVIPAGHGVRCSEFPKSKPGTFACSGPTVDGTVRGRIDLTTDERRDHVVALWRDNQPELERRAVTAAGDAYTRRNRSAPGDTDGGDGGESAGHDGGPKPKVPDFSKAQRTGDAGTVPGRLSPDESRRLVFDALASFPDGAGPSQVAEACGKSPVMVRARLAELIESGAVSRSKRGRYTAIDSGAVSADGGSHERSQTANSADANADRESP